MSRFVELPIADCRFSFGVIYQGDYQAVFNRKSEI